MLIIQLKNKKIKDSGSLGGWGETIRKKNFETKTEITNSFGIREYKLTSIPR